MPNAEPRETQVLENRFLKLEILVQAGRVMRLVPTGGSNLFADSPPSPVPTPYGDYYYRGGHRLWHSPEAMPRTYIPENEGFESSSIEQGLRIDQPPEPWTQIAKRIEVRLDPDRPRVEVKHILRNAGAWTVELAAWAVTMFRLGGVGIFPQPPANSDGDGLLPNRHLAFWPYASVRDPRLTLGDDFILLRAEAGPPFKFGYRNRHGWIGYWLEGVLFVKRFEAGEAERSYPDGGCNVESYGSQDFFELESLGPLTKLEPGASLSHVETWEIYDRLDPAVIPPELEALIALV